MNTRRRASEGVATGSLYWVSCLGLCSSVGLGALGLASHDRGVQELRVWNLRWNVVLTWLYCDRDRGRSGLRVGMHGVWSKRDFVSRETVGPQKLLPSLQ